MIGIVFLLSKSQVWALGLKKLYDAGVPIWIIVVIGLIIVAVYIYMDEKSKSTNHNYSSSKNSTKKTAVKPNTDENPQPVLEKSEENEMEQGGGASIKDLNAKIIHPISIYLPPYYNLQEGHYTIISHLASGGFGNTYLAKDNHNQYNVAIKELYVSDKCSREHDSQNVCVDIAVNKDIFGKYKQKFIKEALRLQSFHHPNIVKVYDCFEENATAYYVMEYLPGMSLAGVVKEHGHLSEQWVRNLLPGIIDSLRTIHAEHIWHLDLKPSNLMLRDKHTAVLIDFGASKQFEDKEGQQMETSSMVAKTNHFAPLEQTNHNTKNIGPWTDIYALGATLFFLLSGQIPPTPDTILSEDLPPLPDYVSQEMANSIRTMMQPDKRNRPQNIEEVAQLLQISVCGQQKR